MYNVAIVGAGPAGCMLARLLLNAGIQVTVFESNPEPRPAGGTLDLHADTGLAALKKAGLYEKFTQLCRYDGESMQIVDRRAVHLLNSAGATGESARGRPEIDRPQLVHLLIDSLPAGTIKFGHKLLHLDSSLTLYFERAKEGGFDWTEETGFERCEESGFDLIVGADGAWSKTRRYLSDAHPYYTGISGYECSIPDAKINTPDLYKFVRRGSVFGFDDRKTIMAQQMGDGSIKGSAWMVQAEPSGAAGNEAIQRIHDAFAGWSPQLLEAVQTPMMQAITFRPLYMLPIGFRWVHRSGVTLIGDAAHLMTPFAGEGVNAALRDAMDLADHIIAATPQQETDGAAAALDAQVLKAEEEQFVRAEAITTHTWNMTKPVFFESGGPWSNIEKYVLTAASDEVPSVLWPAAVALAYGYFAILRLFRAPPKQT